MPRPAITEETQTTTLVARGKLTEKDYKYLEWWDLMERMEEVDWEDKKLYIYRQNPPHERLGEKQSITQQPLRMSMTRDQMEQAYGGGVFWFVLKGPGGGQIRQATKTILGEPKWTEYEKPLTRPQTSSAAPAPSATSELTSILDRMAQQAQERESRMLERIEKLTEQVVQGSGRETRAQDEAVKSVVTIMSTGFSEGIKMMNAASQHQALGPKDLFDAFTKGQEVILKQIKEQAVPAASPADPIEQLSKVVNAAKVLRDELDLGGAKNPKAELWGIVANTTAPALQELAHAASYWVRMKVAQTNMRPAARTLAAAPGEVGPAPAIPPLPSNMDPVVIEQPEVGVDPVTAVKRKFLQIFYEGRAGGFACEYLQLEAPPLYQTLLPIVRKGKEALLKMVNDDTVLQEAAGHANLESFLQEISEYVREEDAAAEQDKPAEAPVQ